jgi:hypothetical protein
MKRLSYRRSFKKGDEAGWRGRRWSFRRSFKKDDQVKPMKREKIKLK